jgi:hypothetical protein
VRGRSRRASAGIFRNLSLCEPASTTIGQKPQGFANASFI